VGLTEFYSCTTSHGACRSQLFFFLQAPSSLLTGSFCINFDRKFIVSLHRRDTFKYLESWLQECVDNADGDLTVLLVRIFKSRDVNFSISP
jgi:hypothetical protein